MLTLFFAPQSSSMAPHIALHEIGAPFATRPLSLVDEDNRAPAFLAINPEGKVPTLLVDGRAITEVAGILFYLARSFAEAGLIAASGSEEEAQTIACMSFLAASAHPARRDSSDAAHGLYAIAEARLGSAGWPIGDRFSIADIHLFRLFWRFHASAGLPRGQFPKLFAS
ncbi:glutathione S-transferase family protein [soil metagenome]